MPPLAEEDLLRLVEQAPEQLVAQVMGGILPQILVELLLQLRVEIMEETILQLMEGIMAELMLQLMEEHLGPPGVSAKPRPTIPRRFLTRVRRTACAVLDYSHPGVITVSR